MVDIERIRIMREQIREIIGFKDGAVVTDEMLSAPMAILAEVWTMRIYCSPEKHTQLPPQEIMKMVSEDFTKVMQAQAKHWLPHAKTFGLFIKEEKGGQHGSDRSGD